MVTPVSIRFRRAEVAERLKAEAGARNVSTSALAEELIEEGLRARRHPMIVFRDGASGRRAGLIGGPDVWEVVGGLVGGDVPPEDRIAVRPSTWACPTNRSMRCWTTTPTSPPRSTKRSPTMSLQPTSSRRRGGGAKAFWRGEATARRPPFPPGGPTTHGCRVRRGGCSRPPRLGDPVGRGAATRASAEERAVVTENAKDFDRIVRSWMATGEHHAGVVFTSPRRFHRGGVAYPENLIASLTPLLESRPEAEHDWVHWLQ